MRELIYSMTSGGTPYFPTLDKRIDLELVDTKTFGSRLVYLRYRRIPQVL